MLKKQTPTNPPPRTETNAGIWWYKTKSKMKTIKQLSNELQSLLEKRNTKDWTDTDQIKVECISSKIAQLMR